jgi:DNA-binding MarR family transcriptional regulator
MIARPPGLSKQATGRTVDTLEQRGFAARSRRTVDRRAQGVSMTDRPPKIMLASLSSAR